MDMHTDSLGSARFCANEKNAAEGEGKDGVLIEKQIKQNWPDSHLLDKMSVGGICGPGGPDSKSKTAYWIKLWGVYSGLINAISGQ